MNSIRFPLGVLLALVVMLIAQLAYYYPQLPETVASHFDSLLNAKSKGSLPSGCSPEQSRLRRLSMQIGMALL